MSQPQPLFASAKSPPLQLVSDYSPQGDQPQAIDKLVAGLSAHKKNQVLLGVTGSGKTYTMAQVIERTQQIIVSI